MRENVGGAIEAAEACDAESVPSSLTSAGAVAAYLGASAAEAARVGHFPDHFANADALGPSDAWQNVGDEDLYRPAALR